MLISIPPTAPDAIGSISPAVVQNTRNLDLKYGRLMAISWLRQEAGICLERAELAYRDIVSLKPWTYPEVLGCPHCCTLPRNASRLLRCG